MIKYLYKRLPVINCMISTTALLFQVTVLNPWHAKISIQINDIQKQLKEMEKTSL